LKGDIGDGTFEVDALRIYIKVFGQLGAINGLDDLVFGELIGGDAFAEQGSGYKEGVGYLLAKHVAGEGPEMGGIDGVLPVTDLYDELSAVQGGITEDGPESGIGLQGRQQSPDCLFQF